MKISHNSQNITQIKKEHLTEISTKAYGSKNLKNPACQWIGVILLWAVLTQTNDCKQWINTVVICKNTIQCLTECMSLETCTSVCLNISI